MEEIALSTIRLSFPLLFAALGGLLSERSGVANVALEAFLLVSAFSSAAIISLTGFLSLGILVGLVVSMAFSLLFTFICLKGRADQVVIGMGMNLLAMGLIPVVTKTLFDVTGSTPSLAIELRLHNTLLLVTLALFVTSFVWVFLNQTKLGLHIKAAGENPEALERRGVSPFKTRMYASALTGLLVGMGGIILSLYLGSGYIRNMSAGRGFIALAALILGAWKPIPTLIACLSFGFIDALQIRMQGLSIANWDIPHQLIQILPFVLTLLGLYFFSHNMKAPSAINRPED